MKVIFYVLLFCKTVLLICKTTYFLEDFLLFLKM